ncbi:MAG: site-2 protease family protein [Phycisphaerales bacterium]|nr:site-2 protease family protein [Phycisphaerales bacterium]
MEILRQAVQVTFHWRDALGGMWVIELDAAGIRLVGETESFEIPRDRWPLDVSVAAVKEGYVARFCGPQRDVGFLVGAEGAALAEVLGHVVTAAPRDVAFAEAPPDDRPVLFPKMNRTTVLALLLAGPAFIPVYGVAFALASLVMLGLGRRSLRPSRDFSHVRTMRRFTLLWLLFNLAVWGLTTFKPSDRQRPRLRRADITAPQISDAPSSARARPARQEPPMMVYVVVAIVVSLLSLSVHECAHAITALWNGDDYARSLGRVTLNPLAHIDPFGTVLLPAILFFTTGMTFGYARPVPVMPSRMMYHRISDIYVSAAGPVSNLLIACAGMGAYLLVGRVIWLVFPEATIWEYRFLSPSVEAAGLPGAAVWTAALRMLSILVLMNVGLAFFNLLPIPPLDGSHVCGNLYPRTIGRFFDAIRPYQIPIFIILLWTGAMRAMLGPTMSTVVWGLQWTIAASVGR